MRKKTDSRPILPVCLLVAGRPCLVVGGGQIATRKTGHLLDAKADVTVVSSTVTDKLRALARSGKIRISARAFAESDLKGKYLVFATTDNKIVNRRVLAACRKRRILCGAADSNWPKGDFVTPAICRKSGLVITVATGGRSCRQARIVKDRIAQMLASLNSPQGEVSPKADRRSGLATLADEATGDD